MPVKFSIRDLLLVTVIAAVGTSWWLDRTRLAMELRQCKGTILKPLTAAPLTSFGLTPNGTPVATLDLEWKQLASAPSVTKVQTNFRTPPGARVEQPDFYPHGHMEGRQRVTFKGDRETFPWQDAVGKRVTVEGLAWGSIEKGLGEYVIMNEAQVFVEPGDFLNLDVYGRMVSVTGTLRLKTGIAGSPLRIFVIEDADVQPIEKVKWPWMTRERGKSQTSSEPDVPTVGEKQEKSPLEGEWVVTSANFELSGFVYYTFHGSRLTVVRWTSQEKNVRAPKSKSVEQWTVEIDETKSPPRLVMTSITPIAERAVTLKEAFQLQEGELWLREDDGQPIDAESFDPQLSNDSRRLTGLRRQE